MAVPLRVQQVVFARFDGVPQPRDPPRRELPHDRLSQLVVPRRVLENQSGVLRTATRGCDRRSGLQPIAALAQIRADPRIVQERNLPVGADHVGAI